MSHASEQAVKRASEAETAIDRGDVETANRLLREASSLDSTNSSVKAVWDKLQANESHILQDLCERFLDTKLEDDAEAVLDHLTSVKSLSPTSLATATQILLQYSGDIDAIDQVTGQLLSQAEPQKVLAAALLKSPTTTFNTIFDRGDDSMEAQTRILLDSRIWEHEKDRIAAERDVFQLALAQLMRAGQDFPERAMKTISHLLGAEAKNLNGLIDADGFEVILDNLDVRLPSQLRAQASLACVKLLELSPENAKALISQYVIQHIQKPIGDRLIQAFSAAAAVFPMAPDAAAELFLKPGFLPNFVKLVTDFQSQRVEQAALDLLDAACMDGKCRVAIRKYCPNWLEQISSGTLINQQERRESQVTTANLIQEKIKNEKVENQNPSLEIAIEDVSEQEDRLDRFISLITTSSSSNDPPTIAKAVEGIAFASTKAWAKERLAHDKTFLSKLAQVLEDKSQTSSVFGCLTILSSLTAYRPVLSEEQKKLVELKAYANTTKPAPTDPLDDDEKVSARCDRVLKAGIMSSINKIYKSLSKTSLLLAVEIVNSLAKDKPARGLLAQQGALRFLAHSFDQDDEATRAGLSYSAAHAMARILITVNPNHAFGSTSPITSAVRPLSLLLAEDSDASSQQAQHATRTLLPVFEALLALTNLASVSAAVCEAIVRSTWSAVQDRLLSDNTLVQRAAAELVCNLCGSPAGAAQFTGAQADANLKILLALADAADTSTRRASAGALAMLTEWDEVVDKIARQADSKGVLRLLALMEDEDEQVVIRGAVALSNAVSTEGQGGRGVVAILRRVGDCDKRLERIYGKGDESVKKEIGTIAAALGGRG